ncbi:MAG: nicotinate-nucleotide--dimethylbenzimidazole phosphoribosyltransferase [Eubacterium sp.]|nr:nicotinate-nucleotide--dimethylbenzimidazole phosphoribosyltransferase [Eubacterium sp.]
MTTELKLTPLIEETIQAVRPADQDAREYTKKRWNVIAKPLNSLGMFEDILTGIAGTQRTPAVSLHGRTLLVFCADNGIVEEKVSQTGQDVTAKVAANLACEQATAAIFCREADVQILPVDVGMVQDVAIRTEKQAYGTKNFAVTDAMSRDAALKTIETGIRLAKERAEAGDHILMIGEMGIGNTSTSSAVAAVLLGVPVSRITGRGAGLSDTGLAHKREVLTKAIDVRRPDPADPVDVLAKVGGFDIAAMTGLIIGAAAMQIPVILDGFISAVGALAAVRLCPAVRDCLVPSHSSSEPGADIVLNALQMQAPLQADMRPGEGCGAVLLLKLLDMILKIYQEMPTFEDIAIEAYQPYPK